MIKFYFAQHAEERRKQRNIRKEEIEEALNDPDSSYPGKQGELNLLKELPVGSMCIGTYNCKEDTNVNVLNEESSRGAK